MKQQIRLIFGFIFLSILISFQFPSIIWAESTHSNHEHQHKQYIKGVGPGDKPHFHNFDISNLKRIPDIAKAPNDVPPPIKRTEIGTVIVKLEAQEVISTLADGTEFAYWTYNQTVPGPLLRARIGDTVELSISNHPTSTHDHSIDLHAVTGPGGGASLTQVKPGESKTISFKALNAGVFVYHCASGNVPSHIANGLYGLIIIEPEIALPPVDHEYYVMQGEIYTKGSLGEKGLQNFSPEKMINESPEYIVLNGRVKSLTGDNALKANSGETIRIFFGNAGVSKISSFHIIGEIFDKVFPEASLSTVHESIQTTLVPAGGAVVVELKLESPGTFVLLDHAIARIDRGAYGILQVEGKPNADILRQK
jgi:nitrite reductase (NO-forming)